LDTNVRRMAAEVPQLWPWDNHGVANSWSDAKDFSADALHTKKNVPLLVARVTQSFVEYAPVSRHTDVESECVHRYLPQGPLLDLFVVDMRSYRGSNSSNLKTTETPASAFMGWPQIAWLLEGLKKSKSVWKVTAADMPIGLQIGDGKDAEGQARWAGGANGDDGDDGDDGAPLGREIEMFRLLREIKRAVINNVVWLIADVPYTAAHYFDPAKPMSLTFLRLGVCTRPLGYRPFWP
jgi:alkaline phosphatase D